MLTSITFYVSGVCKHRCLRYDVLHLVSFKWKIIRQNKNFLLSLLSTNKTAAWKIFKNRLINLLSRLGQIVSSFGKYSLTCIKQAPKGQSKSACLRQVLAKCRCISMSLLFAGTDYMLA